MCLADDTTERTWTNLKGIIMSLTQEEIKALAIECGAELVGIPYYPRSDDIVMDTFELAAYTASVEAKERDRCAVICDARAKLCATRADLTDDEEDRTDLKSLAWQFAVLASEIRSLK